MYAIVESAQVATETICQDCLFRPLSICRVLADDELAQLHRLACAKVYPSHSVLFREGEAGDFVFNITSGMVRLSRLLSDGRRQILGFALPGDFLGLALTDRHKFTAETIGTVEVCRFERGGFEAYVEMKPHLLRSLHIATANELAICREQMVLLGRRTAEEKVAAFLLGLRARYRRIMPCDVTVPLPMTRQDIADYCGLTLETVSRTLSRMAREKILLVVPDGVRLVMLDRLQGLIA